SSDCGTATVTSGTGGFAGAADSGFEQPRQATSSQTARLSRRVKRAWSSIEQESGEVITTAE
ncbi:MAG: hypothetical protein ACK48Y_18665, partial [Planctomyces sp.]